MKRNLIGILTLVVLSMFVSATGAYAQNGVKANVPFDFNVGKVHMKAGPYVIREERQDTILIQGSRMSTSALSLVRRDAPNVRRPRLVFHRYGNRYFLTQIWGEYGTAGLILPTSKLEKELQLSEAGEPDQGVVVLALN